MTAQVDCPAGKLLLGGGATATTSAAAQRTRVVLQSSAPTDADTWQAYALVISNLSSGATASLRAHAICTT